MFKNLKFKNLFKIQNLKFKNQRKSEGFTLIEVLIAIGILSGIIFIVSFFGLDVFTFQLFLGETFTAQEEITATLTEMGIQVRAMGPAANGGYLIESASSTSFTFYTDIDGDDVFERVRYFITGDTLNRGVVEPIGNPAVYITANETVRNVVNNVIIPPEADEWPFTYYGSGYTGSEEPLSAPVDINRIRLINVTITVDKNPQNQKNRLDYSSLMMIRNLRNTQ